MSHRKLHRVSSSNSQNTEKAPPPDLLAWLIYKQKYQLNDEECREAEEACRDAGIELWELWDFKLLQQFEDANVDYKNLCNHLQAIYWSKEQAAEQTAYLRDWRGLRDDISLLKRKWCGDDKRQGKFRSKLAPKVLGPMLERFYKDIRFSYPIAIDGNNPAKGLAGTITARHPGIRVHRPTTFDEQIDIAALKLHQLGHSSTKVTTLLAYSLQRMAPPSVQPLPRRYKDTLKKKVQKVLERQKPLAN